ncbi:MAG: glycine zipper family protein [Burkholderiaceae bacterium]
MKRFSRLAVLTPALLVLGACAVTPTGPTQLVLPGSGKTFQQFRVDDAGCRQHASAEIGDSAQTAAADATARSAVVGTAVGTVAGAAIGGSRGAGVGAGTGLLFGTAAGSNAGAQTGYSAQRRYDNAYIQCMYAAGHRVPVSGQFIGNTRAVQQATPTPPSGAEPPPPPPAGTPPAPPPGTSR